jgi:hypothetical protein
MRTFSCFVSDLRDGVPTLSFILAASENRARELARRELLDIRDSVAVEIVENGRTIAVIRR